MNLPINFSTWRDIRDFLQGAGDQEARLVALHLWAHIQKKSIAKLLLDPHEPLDEQQEEQLAHLLKRRLAEEPLAYLLGSIPFFGIDIELSPVVLIPRPETEQLAELVSHWLKKATDDLVIWELCTGSGALGLSLWTRFPHHQWSLSDISPEALLVAKKNGARLGYQGAFLQGDLLTPFLGHSADLVMANPPYLSYDEYTALPLSILRYEPSLAFVAPEEGLFFYRSLAKSLPAMLRHSGRLFLEIGSSQGSLVEQIFRKAGWGRVEILQDLSGKDRFCIASF